MKNPDSEIISFNVSNDEVISGLQEELRRIRAQRDSLLAYIYMTIQQKNERPEQAKQPAPTNSKRRQGMLRLV